MRQKEASQRYAKALYELAIKNSNVDQVLNEVREFATAISKDAEIWAFFTRPIITTEVQKEALGKFLEKKKMTEEVRGILVLLAEKKRFALLPEIAAAFQAVVDASRGVARGQVSSAATLFPEERQKLEETISRYSGKKAVLEYHENKILIGGLVARVGSYTFDDSLETQLRLMKDSLIQRRAH